MNGVSWGGRHTGLDAAVGDGEIEKEPEPPEFPHNSTIAIGNNR
jgi:hypothetical protein